MRSYKEFHGSKDSISRNIDELKGLSEYPGRQLFTGISDQKIESLNAIIALFSFDLYIYQF